MIAIDTVIKPMSAFESEAYDNYVEFHATSHVDIFEFFKPMIEQNLIVNKIFWDPYDDIGLHQLIRYYTDDADKAKIFQEKILSDTADFSLKKFWNHLKFDYTVEIKEINFSNQQPQWDVINTETGEVWGEIWPVF